MKQIKNKNLITNSILALVPIVTLALLSVSVTAAPRIMGIPGQEGSDIIITDPPEIIVIESVSPETSATGTVITLMGSGFRSASIARFELVGFPSAAAESTGTVISNTELRVTVPENLNCGLHDLLVHSTISPNSLGSYSNKIEFSVSTPCTPVPGLGSINPAVARKGQTVIVSGVNFSQNSVLSLQPLYPPYFSQPMQTNVQGTGTLSFTIPNNFDCKQYTASVSTPGTTTRSNSRLFRVRCPTTANWQIQLDKLVAESVQEDGFWEDGDEPYLIAIGFRSRVLTPGSTTTFWGGYLNDNWADGIDKGNERTIPAQMGVLTYPDVTITPFGCSFAIGCYIEMQIFKPEFIGAVVFAIESDSTPFSTIRDRVEGRKAELQETVRQLIEEFYQNRPVIELLEELDDPIDTSGFGNWFRSFFNRDDFIGAHIFMYPAVEISQNGTIREQDMPISGFLTEQTARMLNEGNFNFAIGESNPRYLINGSIKATPRAWEGIFRKTAPKKVKVIK